MLLALDIGNSTIEASLFEGNSTVASIAAPSTVQRSGDETWRIVTDLLTSRNLQPRQISGIGISSVVPFLTTLFVSLSQQRTGLHPLVISGDMDLGMKIHYAMPAALGPDRICAAVAAYAKHRGPLIVVDFGTATTFGAVSAEGEFLGGAIMSGLKSTAEALTQRTAQLPGFELQVPATPIATDTVQALQAGLVFGAVDAFEGMIRRMRSELGGKARVVATGGLADFMAPLTAMIDVVEPRLVLEGVRIIYERVRG